MEGFGVHTFKMANKEGTETYVKFHWKPTCGVKVLTDEEAKQVGEANNVQSHATEDLWNTIEKGEVFWFLLWLFVPFPVGIGIFLFALCALSRS